MWLQLQIAGKALPYDTIQQMRRRMMDVAPHLTRYGDVEDANYVKQTEEFAKVMQYLTPGGPVPPICGATGSVT